MNPVEKDEYDRVMQVIHNEIDTNGLINFADKIAYMVQAMAMRTIDKPEIIHEFIESLHDLIPEDL